MTFEPEYELLLDAAIPRDPARADLTAWGGSRWGQTLRIADWHRLSPLLAAHLRGRDGVPDPVRHALNRGYLANLARTMFITRTIEQVCTTLTDAGIAPMLLKGAALIESVYADPAEREMLDIDILVPAAELATAVSALAPLGYQAQAEGDGGSTALTPLRHHDAPLVGREELVALELHRHLTIQAEGGVLDIDGVWERAAPGSDASHRLPSPEDLMLHVCLHFTRNRLGGSYRHRQTGGALAQIADISRLAAHRPPDYSRLASIAAASGLTTRVFLGLFAARTLGAPVPADGLRELTPAGFDPALGRRLVALRVMRDGSHLPNRSLRWMFAPSREVLQVGWNADPTATASLARAYLRRAGAHVPEARAALRRPLQALQDRRLNHEILGLERRV